MRLFEDLAESARENEPMAEHTSFGTGGRVGYFLRPRGWDEVDVAYRRSREAGLCVRVLGRGSNTLVADGYHAWVVISTERLAEVRRDGHRIEAGAGLDLRKLLLMAEAWGLGGLETLAGIPGSVGGAVAMNAGGRYGTIADHLAGAVVAFPGGSPRWVDASEFGLAYRGSRFRRGLPFLLSATFALEAASPRALQEERLRILAEKRATQPLEAKSAGCVFKNPLGASAGRLIDLAGLKGERQGGAVVSDRHANFIVNRDNATATDILLLIQRVAQRVQERFGVQLQLEIELWADDEQDEWYPSLAAGWERLREEALSAQR